MAVRALITYMDITRDNVLVLTPTAHQRLIGCCLQFKNIAGSRWCTTQAHDAFDGSVGVANHPFGQSTAGGRLD